MLLPPQCWATKDRYHGGPSVSRMTLSVPILDLQSRAQTGHWKFAFVTGIEAAKWRRSLADCAWWRRSSSSADDAGCVSVCHRCLSRAVATSSIGGMPHHFVCFHCALETFLGTALSLVTLL